MWLIDTTTLRLQFFIEVDPDVQKYAILSHTWGPEEVTLQEMAALESDAAVTKKAGFDKIRRCCERARADGHAWAWVDTCCIDKTSSAELSESINSMYLWYQQARVCYVIMPDVPPETAAAAGADAASLAKPDSAFARSRWFTRGWTLQELIAPREMLFFAADWTPMGSKLDLVGPLEAITSIDRAVLLGETELEDVSLARRFSWAASRNVTKTEDIAYCLLGIFDVNMPMLYGEGSKAFMRLQQEIVKESNDLSIFAWADSDAADDEPRGLLAPHPRCFKGSADFVGTDSMTNRIDITGYGVTLFAAINIESDGGRTAFFDCHMASSPDRSAFIHLEEADKKKMGGMYATRRRASVLGAAPMRGDVKKVLIPLRPRKPKAVVGSSAASISGQTLVNESGTIPSTTTTSTVKPRTVQSLLSMPQSVRMQPPPAASAASFITVKLDGLEGCSVSELWVSRSSVVEPLPGADTEHRLNVGVSTPIPDARPVEQNRFARAPAGSMTLALKLACSGTKFPINMHVVLGVLQSGQLAGRLLGWTEYVKGKYVFPRTLFAADPLPASGRLSKEDGYGYELVMEEEEKGGEGEGAKGDTVVRIQIKKIA